MSKGLTLNNLLGRVARDELPWGRAWVAPFAEFAARFTLHDSAWVGVFLAPGESNECVVVVEWDARLPEPLRSACAGPVGECTHFNWPFLLIRLSDLGAVQMRGYEDPMSKRAIGHAEYRAEEGCGVLEIADVIGGTVRLEYGGRTEFLALDSRDGQVLELEQAEPRSEPPEVAKPWWKIW